jgi:O-acetyl-ADP-ribose deacetylase (regulator of RNase III)
VKLISGNILESNAEALVNTVNTVGVMGKGIALQFREQFPINYELYAAACRRGEVQTGKMFITATNSMLNPKWIINFPTKKHWIHKSSYAFIEAGLDDLVVQIKKLNIQSIAIPPLGAGQGGLDWAKVKQIIEQKLGALDIEIIIFEPVASWSSKTGQPKTHLTKARALVLALINQYRQLGFDVSLLEIQKLAYFLQRMGQTDLKLNYQEYLYGPYAHNLQHLLHELEKGYIITDKSILDSRPLDVVFFNSAIADDVSNFVATECSEMEKVRLQKLVQLMAGFESPFGLELLSTVDWIVNREGNSELSALQMKEKVKDWSKRKDENFNLGHLTSALVRLNQFRQELAYT